MAEEIAGTPASPALSRPGRTGALKDEVDDNMGGRGRGGVRDSDRGRCGSWPRGEDEVKVWIGDVSRLILYIVPSCSASPSH